MSGMFSIPSPSSGGSTSSRGRSSTPSIAESQRPRRKSPPSMYVAYDSGPAKAPKPLIKLDKKKKGVGVVDKGKEKEGPLTRARSSTVGSGASSIMGFMGGGGSSDGHGHGHSVPRRPSVTSFLSLRSRKPPASTPTAPMPSRELSPPRPGLARSATTGSSKSNLSGLGYHLPRPPPPPPSIPASVYQYQQTHIHPTTDVDDNLIEEVPRNPRQQRSDKAARLLGGGGSHENLSSSSQYEYSKYRIPDATYYLPGSGSGSGSRPASPLSSETSSISSGAVFTTRTDSTAASDEAEASYYTEEGGWYADSEHRKEVERDSMLLSPIEFRPPSFSVLPNSSELEPEDEAPATPIASRSLPPPPRPPRAHAPPRVDSHIHHAYAYAHLRSESESDRQHAQHARPDTPFMDNFVAVTAQVEVVSTSPSRHTREPSVIRAEHGWRGEWNQGDMHEVISKLRTLK
ncbi:hypothetical protein C8F01DRAFT_48162 [Mycena amicta]|nr:hypothetical protein C8F01DRAFT_48162 [Mycena amicta]